MKELLLFFFPLIVSCEMQKQNDLSQYTDLFIGTAYVGHTHPSAQLPFGMVQVGPDTGTDLWEHCSGYYDGDSTIIGFSHTHLSGTGCPDMGDIMLMPVVGDVPLDRGVSTDTSTGYRSAFSHQSEEATPGYYKVQLDDYEVKVELTATQRVGYHQYTYPASEQSGLVIDLGHGIGDEPIYSSMSLVNDTIIVGMRRSKGFVEDHSYYFYAVISKPVNSVSSFADNIISHSMSVEGKDTKLHLAFSTQAHEIVTVKVALSTVSIDGAQKNLLAEVKNSSFDEIRLQAKETWNSYLQKIQIEPLNADQQTSFYTALYHALLMPNLVSDVDGCYSLPDGTLANDSADHYTNFSLWDTYRSAHPFYLLMYSDKNNDFVRSMLSRFSRNGILSTNEYGQNETWCMIGNHAVPVLADVYVKGTMPEKNKEIEHAIYNSLTISHPKSDWGIYDKYGYYPFDLLTVESVSRTLEHCYDDYCAALVYQRSDSIKHRFFRNRSGNYVSLFDKSIGLMRPKDSNGTWRSPFDPFLLCHAGTSGGDYTEGNAWQYTWHIQHDIPKLVELMGGKDSFESKLDSLFFLDVQSLGGGFHGDVTGLIGQYAHGNEPSHHISYLYNYTNHPYKTQSIIRDIFNRFYLTGRDGLSGNDDCGQMSTWYIFSAMGFYTVNPVSGEYIIGAPQVKKVTLNLPNGKHFVVTANKLSTENKFIESVTLNGKTLDSFKINYKDIMNGGELIFEMSSQAK